MGKINSETVLDKWYDKKMAYVHMHCTINM